MSFNSSWGLSPRNWRSPVECALNLPVPYRSGSDRQLLNGVPVGVDQHFAPADMVGLADQAVLFHPLDQASGAIVADAQLALEVRRRGLLAFGDDLDRLPVKLRLGVVLAGRLAVEKIAAVFGL